jgi:hypothetical protein
MATGALERCEIVEECYEAMLAYAARGLPADEGSQAGAGIRETLRRAAEAVDGLAESCAVAARESDLPSADRFGAFLEVLARDARDSLAAVELVLAQPRIGSQLVDNLNASAHLRALLADLFLVGDVLRAHRASRRAAAGATG